ncbi:MAG TPA: GFA family protein [Acidobacteriota bacterium]|nr:GFA family protein [Acidobacteriota bacterium]
MSEETIRYAGGCACGAVQVTVTGKPRAAGYCHCETCRRWHTAPINAWAAWPADAVAVTQGEEELLEFDAYRLRQFDGHQATDDKGSANCRCSCRRCGAGVMNRRRDGVTVVYPSALYGSAFNHAPTVHIHYQERVLDVQDGLPKFADGPAEYGGSGEMIDEPRRTGPASDGI